MQIFVLTTTRVVVLVLSCASLKRNSTRSETPAAVYYMTHFMKDANISKQIFHREYQLLQSNMPIITNLNQMLRPFKHSNCLVHITSYQSTDIHSENNFPRILGHFTSNQIQLESLTFR